jgi:hypothetical protein
LSALNGVRFTEATNPRDKVYAALGLVGKSLSPIASDIVKQSVDQDDKPMDVNDVIKVDYGSNVEDILVSTTKSWIERQKGLHILDYCVPSCRSQLPSWVVDWTDSRSHFYTRIALPKCGSREHDLLNGDQRVYSAGGDYPLEFKFDNSDKTLVLKGFQLDRVEFANARFLASPERRAFDPAKTSHIMERAGLMRAAGEQSNDVDRKLIMDWLSTLEAPLFRDNMINCKHTWSFVNN